VQQWRNLKNPISQGRLSSATASDSLHIGIMHTDGNFKELVDLLKENKQFAMLCPIGIISQLSRRENRENNQWSYDKDIDQLVIGLSKLVLSHDNQVWLINLNNHPRFVEVLSTENVGCSLDQAITTCCDALCHLVMEQQPLPDWDTHDYEVSEEQLEHYVQTRIGKSRTPRSTNNARSLKNRNAIVVDPIVNWVGKQLEGQTVPQTIIDRLQSNYTNFPSGITSFTH
jgi:hypothetical protein